MLPRTLVVCFLCAIGCSVVRSKTIYLELNTPTSEELSFLKKYGYLPDIQDDADFAFTPQSISEALQKMQAFAGLPQTGAMDSETKKLFKRKRCGVKDVDNSFGRSKRYTIQQSWNKKSITYRVLNGSSTIPRARVETLMGEGLAVWAPHGGLQFTRMDHGKADIMVFFASGEHGDGFPFDGPGRVVAHAFSPPQGDMHFDDDEIWGDIDSSADEDEDITNFFAVAVHEIGHALGLSHSSVKDSVMYPYYQVPIERLHMDDILGMQELYLKEPSEGTSSENSSPSVPRFTKADSDYEDTPDLCLANYDTVQVIHGKIYVFEEEWVWVLRDRNVLEAGSPRRYHDVFRGLPARVGVVTTVYEKFNRNVVIFSGRNFWEFSPSLQLVTRGNISEYALPPRVAELTSVFISNYNNKTYLIEEEQFWRYDEKTQKMDKGYPKEMSAWRQVPYPVNAAFVWKGDTYFFQGPRFWRFDNDLIAAHPYYPLPVAQIWFNCPPSPEMDNYVTNDGP